MKISKIVLWVLVLGGLLAAGDVMAQNMDSVEGDRRALADLYHATGGDNWKNNSGWLSGNPSNDWYGVQVDGSGRVVKIKLNGADFDERDGVFGGNNLTGSLPASIGNLTKLRYFNVKQNYIEGEIPSSIGNMISLVRLYLNGTLRDEDASWGVNLSKTRSLSRNPRSNKFIGEIPSSIGNLTNLEYLAISGQGLSDDEPDEGQGWSGSLTGGIPVEIGNLTKLKGFYAVFNSLDHIPSSMQNLTELEHLYISDNKLAGTGFPEIFTQMTTLTGLLIQNNMFGGPVPDLSRLKNIERIGASNNGFTGNYPAYLLDGSHTRLNTVGFEWNNLSGDFPENNITNGSLRSFRVDGNNLSGEIPASWGNYGATRKIINFGVGWNNLQGEFPDMSHAYQLRYIRARNNNFTGPLPKLHTDNSSLSNLWFQNNNFSGPVDPSIAEAIKNGKSSFGDFSISNNRFCGEDLEDLVRAVNKLTNGVSFSYGGQQDPICGGYATNDTEDENDGDDSDNGSDDSGEGWLNAPAALSPPHGSNDIPLNPTFEWSDVGADYYILHIRDAGSSGVQIDVTVNGTSITVPREMEPETGYKWRVRGVKDGVEGKWSKLSHFRTVTEDEGWHHIALEAPVLLSPEEDGTVFGQRLSFEWEPVVDADEYIINIVRENEWGIRETFFNSDEEGITITETTFRVPERTLPGRKHYWVVAGVKNGVTGAWSEIRSFTTDSEHQAGNDDNQRNRMETDVQQNYPNPFNPSTQIEFTLTELQNVSLRVYDMAGRQVAVLVDGVREAGRHTATFNADNLASGVYFYRFITDTKSFTKQMTLIK